MSWTAEQVLRPAGSWSALTPQQLGWSFVGFELARLAGGAARTLPAEGRELAIVPLAGRVRARLGGREWTFGGRASVFDGLGDCLYVPCGEPVELEALGAAEVAICSARAERALAPALVEGARAGSVVRGAGNATRQVATPIGPDFPAQRLLVVEVWTPGGNWSSYPPHKHDEARPGEAVLEETYYYRTRRPAGFALQRLYSPERDVESCFPVRDGDLAALPWGYHTTVAAHGHDLYYLNVLAGPGERALSAWEDPALAGTRAAWSALAPDPRVPLVPTPCAATEGGAQP